MDEKKQKKIIKKCLKKLSSKNGVKICSFLDLANSLKISLTTLRRYELNKTPEIIEIIRNNRHEKVNKKRPKKSAGVVQEKITKTDTQKETKNNLLRSYEEIRAKLFGYKAWKRKNYSKATPSAKILIDRQISLLEWVMMINKLQSNKEGNGNENQNFI